MDNDDAGRSLSDIVADAVKASGRADLSFRIHTPDQEGADWNDILKAKATPFPTARLERSFRPKIGS